ncbi:Transferase [Corchorus olitorius]|uniref:Transferase n=1 Tax=Corchorus olitorius TaxID=93759 RepID=A0A1R3GJ96_9ROSI|nr:Transferase [Corchorus olitorius]
MGSSESSNRPKPKGILFQKPTPLQEKETDQNTLIHHLKASLTKTLDYFPPLAGRLATVDHEEDDSISYFIDCNNAGALFIHAAADSISISDIIKPAYVPQIVHSFFPLNGLNNYEGVANPLLGIQVTDLEDGIFIGCTINHSVVDGSSLWHFLNLWSEISRGSIPLSNKLPLFQRWLPNGVDLPIHIPKSYLKQVYAEEFIVPPLLEERIFHFTRENIAKLKAKANAEVGTNSISSFQALLSHIWRSVIRNRNINGDEETGFCIVIGARQRLKELSESYFGNAIQDKVVTMKAKDLLKEGIGRVAWKMNRMIVGMTEENVKNFLVSWPASPQMVTMDSMTNRNKWLVTFNSPRSNVYGNDFGWGKPIAARSGPAYQFDGKIALYCGAEEGSIDIEACLSPQTLEAMGKDEEFMDSVAF